MTPSPRSEPARDFVALGVNCDREFQTSRLDASFPKRKVVGPRKFRQTRIAEECFKADHTAIRQFRHLSQIAGSKAAPDPEVRNGRNLKGGTLPVKLARIDRTRRRVERHIEEGGATARRKRAAAGRGAFPLGAARLVEVQVDVDHRGENMQAPRIDFGRP